MKKFAVILIIAVLALGCVFATATGSDGKIVSTDGTNGDKFYVTTQIGRIYPVYQIVGTGKDTSKSATSASSETPANTIEGAVSTVGAKEYLSVTVDLQHYGLDTNDTASDPAGKKANIRYKGTVNVTITASELKNIDSTATADALKENSDKHIYMSELPKITTNFTAKDATNLDVTEGTAGSNATTVKVEYTNGKAVLTGNNAVSIATGCIFQWETTDLTAGDHYKADITVTYTSV